MKKITFLFILFVVSGFAIAQEVQVEVDRLGAFSSTSWSISDEFGQNIVSSSDFDESNFITSLEANTKYYFNINVNEISGQDTSLFFLKLNNEPIILINTNVDIGDHSYLFYTGRKDPELRIVGGSDVSIEDFPWQVFFTSGDYMCGGTIISENWILTAAHCTFDDYGRDISSSDMSILVGTTYPYRSWLGKEYAVKNVIVHENYNVDDLEYDIAILELEESINFENAEPIELISADDVEDGATAPGVLATVSGWGLTNVSPVVYATELQAVELPIVSNETAAKIWGDIDETILMAGYSYGGKDACNGDSGGPLIVDVGGENKLAGIVSWGSSNCNTYGGYTRVSSYVDWIYENTDINRPVTLNSPAGTSSICDKEVQYSYETDSIEAISYEWSLLPDTAGTLSYDGTESTVTWSDNYFGIAQLKVRAQLAEDYTSWAITKIEIPVHTNINYVEGDTTICNKENVSLHISATGDDLSYDWYQNSEYTATTYDGYLDLNRADTTKTGIYYCNVIGTCGTLQSREIEMTVYPTTEIYSTPEDQQLIQNSDATLNVLSRGHNLTYQWYKDGETIVDGGDMNYLELLSLNATDIGQYWLEVEGTCGSDVSDSIYIFVDLTETTGISAKVWPTFTTDNFNVAISNTNLYTVKIYNTRGQIIYSSEEFSLQTSIDISTWADGLYIVKINSEGVEETVKIIKY